MNRQSLYRDVIFWNLIKQWLNHRIVCFCPCFVNLYPLIELVFCIIICCTECPPKSPQKRPPKRPPKRPLYSYSFVVNHGLLHLWKFKLASGEQQQKRVL
jgi:hypothetical protein